MRKENREGLGETAQVLCISTFACLLVLPQCRRLGSVWVAWQHGKMETGSMLLSEFIGKLMDETPDDHKRKEAI